MDLHRNENSSGARVVAPDPAAEEEIAVAWVVPWLPGDGMRRIEHLDAIGHLIVPVRMVGVVHGHAEDLPRRRQGLAAEGIADPARAVNRGMLSGFDEDREDGLGPGLNGKARADRCACHGS